MHVGKVCQLANNSTWVAVCTNVGMSGCGPMVGWGALIPCFTSATQCAVAAYVYAFTYFGSQKGHKPFWEHYA